jgi:UDP-N-acetyl-D-mannosaminuronic acid dehydrogenase
MGYVGLTLAVAMAERGFIVTGLEKSERILGVLTRGKAHFYEAGLEVRMERALKSGALAFHRSASDAKWQNDEAPTVFVITVGTPLGPDGAPRMDMVEGVAREVAGVMADDALVVLRSTVRLGTSRRVVLPILQGAGRAFHLAYCPERTIEGRALEELAYLPQIVGGLTEDDAWRAAHLFQHLTSTTVRVSSLEAAEIIKLLDNSYRDLIFALGNEVALLCDAAGLDGIEIINAANMGYERTNIARPGFVGGPCLQKDPHILMDSLRDFSHVPSLIKAGREMNEALPKHVVAQVLADLPRASLPKDPVISVCGLAFKGRPETDDVRGTPAKELIDALRGAFPSARLRGQDFKVGPDAIRELGLEPVSLEDAFKGANIVIVANNNARYQWVNVDALVAAMARPGVLFDGWAVLPLGDTREEDGVKIRRLGSASAWRKGS